MISLEQTQKLFELSLSDLIRNDTELILNYSSERSLFVCLASYLEIHLSRNTKLDGHSICVNSTNYRNEETNMLLPRGRVFSMNSPFSNTCELSLHGTSTEENLGNLILIKIKNKNDTLSDVSSDKEELSAMTGGLNGSICYALGVYIDLDINNRKGQYLYFQNGQELEGPSQFLIN